MENIEEQKNLGYKIQEQFKKYRSYEELDCVSTANLKYKIGDDVAVSTKKGVFQDMFGKVTRIVKADKRKKCYVSVSWYLKKGDEYLTEQQINLDQHQLVMTDYEDWIIADEIKGKIKVWNKLKFNQNRSMRNMKNIYYCRSYYDPDEAEIRVISEDTNVCLCDLEESFYDCWLCSKQTII